LDDWDWDGPEDVRDDFERVDGRLESGHDWYDEITVLDEKRWGTMSNGIRTRRGSADVMQRLLDDWDWDGPEDVRNDFECVDGRLERGHSHWSSFQTLDVKRWGAMSNGIRTRRGSAEASEMGAFYADSRASHSLTSCTHHVPAMLSARARQTFSAQAAIIAAKLLCFSLNNPHFMRFSLDLLAA
jgi:hypothetical protein